MRDLYDRTIDYMRISVTDRCNLSCSYCMPEVPEHLSCEAILRYEELLQIARAAVEIGITKFKITGGEPLVRKGCLEFMRELKRVPGVRQVTLTTNGIGLEAAAGMLAEIGVDGVNVSLDACERETYRSISGKDELDRVLAGLDACVQRGLHTKINCVLLAGCEDRLLQIAQFAEKRTIDVRFIEVMPIGSGKKTEGTTSEKALEILRQKWPDLTKCDAAETPRGNGPAVYYRSSYLRGRIGVIAAISDRFCGSCNRVRLTSTGILKPCLCYENGTDLRKILRKDQTDERTGEEIRLQLRETMKNAIREKPAGHHFEDSKQISERRSMYQIGG